MRKMMTMAHLNVLHHCAYVLRESCHCGEDVRIDALKYVARPVRITTVHHKSGVDVPRCDGGHRRDVPWDEARPRCLCVHCATHRADTTV